MGLSYCYFRNDLKQHFSSKAKIISDIITFLSAVIFPIVIWYSFMHEDVSAYVTLRRVIINYLFFSLFSYAHYEYAAQLIETGRLNILLLKPYPLMQVFFSQFTGLFCSRILFLLLPFGAWFFLFSLHITQALAGVTFTAVAWFGVFLILLFLLSFFLGLSISAFAFWIGDIWPVRLFLNAGSGAVAGTWFPFENALHFMTYSPFGIMSDGATKFLIVDNLERSRYCAFAFIWVVFFATLSFATWKLGLKKYEGDGG